MNQDFLLFLCGVFCVSVLPVMRVVAADVSNHRKRRWKKSEDRSMVFFFYFIPRPSGRLGRGGAQVETEPEKSESWRQKPTARCADGEFGRQKEEQKKRRRKRRKALRVREGAVIC